MTATPKTPVQSHLAQSPQAQSSKPQTATQPATPAATPTISEVIASTLAEVTPFPDDQLWSEVLPGLWQGGTHDLDTVFDRRGRYEAPAITRAHFDTVVTAYAFARPADWLVTEHRFGFYDGDVEHIDMDRLREVVTAAHKAWKSGDKVLSRCQAGANRSGLITALILIRDGYSPAEAITLIRATRGKQALCNLRFVTWLLNLDTTDWRN